jgi:hypothetical protein
MADLVIADADVLMPASDTVINNAPVPYLTGEDFGTAVPFYLDSSAPPFVVRKADANDPVKSKVVGVTVNQAKAGQLVLGLAPPPTGTGKAKLTFNVGVGLVKGKQYVLSHTTGKIKPIEDLATGDYPFYLFYAESTTVVTLNFTDLGILL